MAGRILQKEDKVLRKTAEPVLIEEIKSQKVKKILKDMKEALQNETDGVAIAAPQIGVSLRIFLVSEKIFNEKTRKKENLVYINPEIVKLSKEKKYVPEGCLSVRWLYGNVRRSLQAKVTAYNEKGEKFTRGGSGLLAQIFQHEIDHLDGALFIDKAKDLVEIRPEELKKKHGQAS
jgi:peptide deformylase